MAVGEEQLHVGTGKQSCVKSWKDENGKHHKGPEGKE